MPNLGRPTKYSHPNGKIYPSKTGNPKYTILTKQHCKTGIPKIPTPMHKIRKV